MEDNNDEEIHNDDAQQHCCFGLKKDPQNGCLFSVCNTVGCLWLYVALFELFFGIPHCNPSAQNPSGVIDTPNALNPKSKHRRKKRRRRRKKGNENNKENLKGEELDSSMEEKEKKIPTEDEILRNFLAVLSIGLPLTFHELNGRARFVTLHTIEESELTIAWKIDKGLQKKVFCVKIKDVKYVEAGLPSHATMHHNLDPKKEEISFVLVTQTNSYLFECTNRVERNAFVGGFSLLINRYSNLDEVSRD